MLIKDLQWMKLRIENVEMNMWKSLMNRIPLSGSFCDFIKGRRYYYIYTLYSNVVKDI
jgi:hypothetical protein